MIVVSEIGEQWSPHTAPAIHAEMEMIISSGFVFWNTATTIGIRIPNVPQDVPVANARKQPTTNTIAGRKLINPDAFSITIVATNTSVMHDYVKNLAKVVRAAREEAHLSQAALAEQIGCDERTILNIENDRGNPKFEVLCQIIAYLHIPADRIFHPDTATDGLKKQKLLLMLQECDEQEAAEILPAIEYLLALIHKRGNSNE